MSENSEHNLLESLIMQPNYTAQACLSESLAVSFALGRISPTVATEIGRHLGVCDGCAQIVRDLQLEVDDLEARERLLSRVLTQISAHPSDLTLSFYCQGLIPKTEGGIAYSQRIESHLRECEICYRRSVRFLELANTMKSLHYRDITSSQKDQEFVPRIIAGMTQLAVVQALARSRRQMSPYRGAGSEIVTAPVLGADGNILLNQAGEPWTVDFGLIAARIKTGGACQLHLSTADSSVLPSEGRRFAVGANLEWEGHRIELPNDTVHADGQVYIEVPLSPELPAGNLPAQMINLVVRSVADPNTLTGGY